MTKLINAYHAYTINVVGTEIIECLGECYFFCPPALKSTLKTTFNLPYYHSSFRLWSVKLAEKDNLIAWQDEHVVDINKHLERWGVGSDFVQPEIAKGLIKINCTNTGFGLLKEKYKDAVLSPINERTDASIFLKPNQVNEAVQYLENYYSPKNKMLRKKPHKKSDDYHKPDVIMNAFDIFEFSQEK